MLNFPKSLIAQSEWKRTGGEEGPRDTLHPLVVVTLVRTRDKTKPKKITMLPGFVLLLPGNKIAGSA